MTLNLRSSAVAFFQIEIMASNRRKRQQEIHFRVMQILHENPEASTRDIARILKISNGTAYYCINALLDKGLIKLKNFAKSSSKTVYIYQLTPRGIKSKSLLTVKFLERKREEYNQLKAEISMLENEVKAKSDMRKGGRKIKYSND